MTIFKRFSILCAILMGLLLSACFSQQAKVALSSEKNPGPCPSAKILYDAARIVEMSGQDSYANVGFTGEIQKVNTICRYVDDSPIYAELDIDFSFGRGPAAEGQDKNYRYFIAVTRVDRALINKEYFDAPVRFERGSDRMSISQRSNQVVIPRANANVSGANFEILVGFELNDQQLAFNRDGKRFRVNAGS